MTVACCFANTRLEVAIANGLPDAPNRERISCAQSSRKKSTEEC